MSNIVISDLRIGTVLPFFGFKLNSTQGCTNEFAAKKLHGCTKTGQIGRINTDGNTSGSDQWIYRTSNAVNVPISATDHNPSSVSSSPAPTYETTYQWLDTDGTNMGNNGKKCANAFGWHDECRDINDDASSMQGWWICDGIVASINASRPNMLNSPKPWYAPGVQSPIYAVPNDTSTCHGCPNFYRNCGGPVVGNVQVVGIEGVDPPSNTKPDNSFTAILSPNGETTYANCAKQIGDTCVGAKFITDITNELAFDCSSFYSNASTANQVRYTIPIPLAQTVINNTPGAVADPANYRQPWATQTLAIAETTDDLYSLTGNGYVAGFGHVLYTPPVDPCYYMNWIKGLQGDTIRIDVGASGTGPQIPTPFISAITVIQCVTGVPRLMAISAFNYFGSWSRDCGQSPSGFINPSLDILSSDLTDAITEFATFRDAQFTPIFQTNRPDIFNQIKTTTNKDFFNTSTGSLFITPVVCPTKKNICLEITVPTDIALSLLSDDQTALHSTNLQHAMNAFFGEGTINGTDYPQASYAFSSIDHYTATYRNSNGVETFEVSSTPAPLMTNNSSDASQCTDTSCAFSFMYMSKLYISITKFTKMTLAFVFKWNPTDISPLYCPTVGTETDISIPLNCFTQTIADSQIDKVKSNIVKYCQKDTDYISARFNSGYDYLLGPDSKECLCYLSNLGPTTHAGDSTSMCFSNACNFDGGKFRKLFGLTDQECTDECPTITGWFGNALTPPHSLDPAELDEGRLHNLCKYKAPFKTDLFNFKALPFLSAVALLITALTFTISKNVIWTMVIASVSLLAIGLLGWGLGAGVTECIPPFNANQAPDLPNITCVSRMNINLPPYLCDTPVTGCECDPSGCPSTCVCHSGTCLPKNGKRPTTNIRVRYQLPILFYLVITLISIAGFLLI